MGVIRGYKARLIGESPDLVRSLIEQSIRNTNNLAGLVAILSEEDSCWALLYNNSPKSEAENIWVLEWWELSCFVERLKQLPLIDALDVFANLLEVVYFIDRQMEEESGWWNPDSFLKILLAIVPEDKPDIRRMISSHLEKLEKEHSTWQESNRPVIETFYDAVRAVCIPEPV